MKAKLISFVFASIAIIVLSGFVFAGWSVSPTNYYFADVSPYETRVATFTLYNGGPYSGAGAVSISGDHPQYFSCISGCAYDLDSGEDQIMKIKFTAPSGGNGGATIEFHHNGTITYGWIGFSVSGS